MNEENKMIPEEPNSNEELDTMQDIIESENTEETKPEKLDWKKELRDWVVAILIAAVVALLHL